MIAPNQVIARYRGGDTVVLQGLHHTDRQLAKVANNLALALDHPVQIERLLLAGGRPRARPPLRLPRRVRRAARRVQALAHLGTAAAHGQSDQGPAHDRQAAVRGARRATARSHAHGRRLPAISTRVPALGGDDRRGIRAPHDRAGRSHLAARGAQSDRRRGRGRTPQRRAAARHARAGCDGAERRSELAGLQDQLAPEVLRHWMAREIWRRQPATRLRPRSVPELGSEPLSFTPGPLVWLTTIGDGRCSDSATACSTCPVRAWTSSPRCSTRNRPIDAE